ncbi:MAG: FAD-dependent oxidoreductase, partial [Oscillospiraceae bacterium]|nr:FAD-dependent oxidoreductase [Oscillospiraceae bacterium]
MKTRTIECDVAVIGAGIAGCAAAQSAAEAGARVVVVERASTVTAHGLDVGAIGSKLQKASGVEIDPLEAARLIYAWGQSKSNYELIRVYTDRSGGVMDHYIDLAEKYGLKVTLNDSMTARPDWDGLEERFRMFRTAHNFAPADQPAAVEDKAAIRHFVRMLRKDAEAHGAQFLFRCTPVKLTKSGARVTGLTAETAEEKLRIRASRGVVLATGGITDNRELL